MRRTLPQPAACALQLPVSLTTCSPDCRARIVSIPPLTARVLDRSHHRALSVAHQCCTVACWQTRKTIWNTMEMVTNIFHSGLRARAPELQRQSPNQHSDCLITRLKIDSRSFVCGRLAAELCLFDALSLRFIALTLCHFDSLTFGAGL